MRSKASPLRSKRLKRAPFASSREHLLAELARIDLLVRAQVFRARAASGDDELRGLSISEGDIDAMLGRPIGAPHWEASHPQPEVARALADVHHRAAEIERRIVASRKHGTNLRLHKIATRFGLDRFELDVLLLALAPEVDARYGRLFAYLHDDVSRTRCSVDLALALLCGSFHERLEARRRFTHGAPLVRGALIKLQTEHHEKEPALIRCSIKVDNRIVNYLHEIDDIDPDVAGFARLITPSARMEDVLMSEDLRSRLGALAKRGAGVAGVLYFYGPQGAGKKFTAEAMCAKDGRRLLIVDGKLFEAAPDEKVLEAARLAAREACLRGASLYWDGADALFAKERRALRWGLLRELDAFNGTVFFASEVPWDQDVPVTARPILRVNLGLPSRSDQTLLWAAALGVEASPEGSRMGDLERLANRYNMTGGQIRLAAATARELARFNDPDLDEPSFEHLAEACRVHSAPKLSSLARKIDLKSAWDDLVLPKERMARLREICNHARYRGIVLDAWGFAKKFAGGKGLSLLFAGPPGTGKTMAASVMASELGHDLYAIDLSNVVNKYIGETEKQLAKIFDEAERSNAVLFFDEADALFGKRTEVKDAHDRFANIETSYLLQRMEAYEGVAILATNLAQNMDEAFVRRIHFIVDFPLPDERDRLRIWQGIFPSGVPRDPELDLGLIAKRFELSGGNIRNIALAASYLAAAESMPVSMKYIVHAIRREYQKMGKIIDERIFSLRS